jgi:hypothetical protein
MRRGLITIGILTGFLLSILMVSGAFAAKDEIIFGGGTQGKVTFNHKKHSETLKIDCVKCHHTWKAGETSGKLCVDCHKATAEGKTLAAKDAFHQDCYKGCHTEAKKANKPAGPTVCTKCHVKAK